MKHYDLRLLLGNFTCDEFLGPNQNAVEAGTDGLVEAIEETGIWQHAQLFRLGLLEARDGFHLFGPSRSPEPELYLVRETPGGKRLAGNVHRRDSIDSRRT